MLVCVAAIATRAPFAVLVVPEAGKVASRVLAYEANASVGFAVVLYLIVRRQARSVAALGRGSVMSGDVLLVFGALFCTVAGYFALQPMMEAARAGQGGVGFGTLHAVSVAFFGLKTLLVLALAWRLGPR